MDGTCKRGDAIDQMPNEMRADRRTNCRKGASQGDDYKVFSFKPVKIVKLRFMRLHFVLAGTARLSCNDVLGWADRFAEVPGVSCAPRFFVDSERERVLP